MTTRSADLLSTFASFEFEADSDQDESVIRTSSRRAGRLDRATIGVEIDVEKDQVYLTLRFNSKTHAIFLAAGEDQKYELVKERLREGLIAFRKSAGNNGSRYKKKSGNYILALRVPRGSFEDFFKGKVPAGQKSFACNSENFVFFNGEWIAHIPLELYPNVVD